MVAERPTFAQPVKTNSFLRGPEKCLPAPPRETPLEEVVEEEGEQQPPQPGFLTLVTDAFASLTALLNSRGDAEPAGTYDYPIGEPGVPWGRPERAAWLAHVTSIPAPLKRSYEREVRAQRGARIRRRNGDRFQKSRHQPRARAAWRTNPEKKRRSLPKVTPPTARPRSVAHESGEETAIASKSHASNPPKRRRERDTAFNTPTHGSACGAPWRRRTTRTRCSPHSSHSSASSTWCSTARSSTWTQRATLSSPSRHAAGTRASRACS